MSNVRYVTVPFWATKRFSDAQQAKEKKKRVGSRAIPMPDALLRELDYVRSEMERVLGFTITRDQAITFCLHTMERDSMAPGSAIAISSRWIDLDGDQRVFVEHKVQKKAELIGKKYGLPWEATVKVAVTSKYLTYIADSFSKRRPNSEQK